MSKVLNDLQAVQRNTGRVRRPSEKVQAMREEQQQERLQAEQASVEKAQRRDVQRRKREQASQAANLVAQQTTFMQESQPVPADSQVTVRSNQSHDNGHAQLMPDKGFSSRHVPVETRLVPRKGLVPPSQGIINPLAMGPLPARGRVYIPAEREVEQRKSWHESDEDAATTADNDDDGMGNDNDSYHGATTGSKRTREREATPVTNLRAAYNLAQLSEIVEDTELGADSPVASTKDLADNATDNPGPRKRARPQLIESNNDGMMIGGMEVLPSSQFINSTIVIDKPRGITTPASGTKRSKSKLSDFDNEISTVITTAYDIYRALLLSENPFPDDSKHVEWIKGAWTLAQVHHKKEFEMGPGVYSVINQRTSQLRGQFKTKARSVVATAYGFETSDNPVVVAKNRKLVSVLKNGSAFVYRLLGSSADEHLGLYTQPAIQQVINEVLFKNKTDDGIKWAKYYNPFPCPGFALALTAMECAIDEWASGTRVNMSFNETEYSPVYDKHLASLEDFAEAGAQHDLLGKLLQQVYNNGSVHAGVSVALKKGAGRIKALPSIAFANAIREYQENMEGTGSG